MSSFLVYEAIRDLPVVSYELETLLAPTTGQRVRERPVIVPILRAGLGMLGAANAHLRDADTAFIGIAKDGTSATRHIYLSSVPENLYEQPALVLDPMLASGHTMIRVCDELVAHNVGRITVVCLLGATEGVERFTDKGYDARLFLAAIDPVLNDIAFIVPGLGDAGDRQFGVW